MRWLEASPLLLDCHVVSGANTCLKETNKYQSHQRQDGIRYEITKTRFFCLKVLLVDVRTVIEYMLVVSLQQAKILCQVEVDKDLVYFSDLQTRAFN